MRILHLFLNLILHLLQVAYDCKEIKYFACDTCSALSFYAREALLNIC